MSPDHMLECPAPCQTRPCEHTGNCRLRLIKTRWALLQAKREEDYRRLTWARNDVPDGDELDILDVDEPEEAEKGLDFDGAEV